MVNLDLIVRKEFMEPRAKSVIIKKRIISENENEEEFEEYDIDEDLAENEEEINRLQSLLNEQTRLKYKNKCLIECVSPFRLDKHLFNHFSVLVQDQLFERFDWSDTIIARDIFSNCFKIQLKNQNEIDQENKIRIEIKYCVNDEEYMDKLKKKFLELIDQLFCYYPGMYFFKRISYSN